MALKRWLTDLADVIKIGGFLQMSSFLLGPIWPRAVGRRGGGGQKAVGERVNSKQGAKIKKYMK
jgi:hypothetical protein